SIASFDDAPANTGSLPIIRGGFVKVYGTVSDNDPGNVVAYKLVVRQGDVVLSGSDYVGRKSAAVLGELDLSQLPNGGYTLDLYVADNGPAAITSGPDDCHHASDSADFFLGSTLQLGRLAFSVTDLQVPVRGVPVSITRNYDSYDNSTGDF